MRISVPDLSNAVCITYICQSCLPPLPQGLLPVIVKEVGHLLKMRVSKSMDILSQLLQSKLGLGFPVRMGKDMHQLLEQTAETAVQHTLGAEKQGHHAGGVDCDA
jgi:hypothetical protein